MPTFQYTAVDAQGKKKKGFIEADTQARAFSLLQDKGLLPMGISSVKDKPKSSLAARLGDISFGGAVRVSEAFFYLGMLLQSGTALAQSLDMLGRMSKGRAGRLWMAVRDQVEAGVSFSDALMQHPKHFSRVYVGMIQVSERVGQLGRILEQIARYEESRGEVRGRLLTALVYPAVILMVGMGAVYFLLTYVLPKIARIFASSKSALPWTTKFLMAVSGVVSAWGPFILLIPLGLGLGAVYAYRRVDKVRLAADRAAWKLPLVRKHVLARFSGLLGFQLEAGIPMVQAMASAAATIPSLFFRTHIDQARQEVASGQPLDKVLARQNIFPDLYILTLSMGQRSGQLSGFLQRIASLFEKDVDNVLKRIVALAEPLLILGVGLTIGFIVVSIMTPIFQLSTLVK